MKLIQSFQPLQNVIRALLLGGPLLLILLAGSPSTSRAGPQGISAEEALEQANELLRSQGIDVTGEGLSPQGGDPSALPSLPAPKTDRAVSDSESATTAFTPLSLDEILNDPDVWPAQVVVLESVDFQSGLRLTPGSQVDFGGFADRENANLDYGDINLSLPVAYTDLVERANSIARGQAKAEGFRGRLPEQLDGRLVVLSGDQMRKSSSEVLGDADLYLLYMASDACGWCRQFTPKLTRVVEQIQRQFPGRLRIIHASVDRNMNEFRSKYRKISADAAIPPGDRWFINAYSTLHPGVSQITQPSLMLLNVNGRLIDSGARQGSNTSDLDAVLDHLPGLLENADALRPAWTRLVRPIPLEQSSSLPAAPDLTGSAQNTDPTLAGPDPYPAVHQDGSQVPGLVLYDRLATGNRIPALTLQRFPDRENGGNYYILAFRQVLGPTLGSSKPLLTAWLHSTTRSGPFAEEDLLARVADFRALHQKFDRWKQTAVSNNVTEIEKPIYTFPQTLVDNRYLRSPIAAPGSKNQPSPDLDIVFVVRGNPEKATLKTETITWMPSDMDAFNRLVPQIDSLVQQLDNEAARLQQDRVRQVQELQDVDALFH